MDFRINSLISYDKFQNNPESAVKIVEQIGYAIVVRNDTPSFILTTFTLELTDLLMSKIDSNKIIKESKSIDVNVDEVEKAEAIQMWTLARTSLADQAQDIPTKTGLWFHAEANHDGIKVSKARSHVDSIQVKVPHFLLEENFIKVYPYFKRWRNGERGIRMILRDLTGNSTYQFAIMERFYQDLHK